MTWARSRLSFWLNKVAEDGPEEYLRTEFELQELKGGVRGKYVKRLKAGTNLVLLSPDVAKYFHDDESVNAALRSLVALAKSQVRRAR